MKKNIVVQDRIELVGEIDIMSSGGKFLRLTNRSAGVNWESFEYYAEKKIINILNLKKGDKVQVVFEVVKRS